MILDAQFWSIQALCGKQSINISLISHKDGPEKLQGCPRYEVSATVAVYLMSA